MHSMLRAVLEGAMDRSIEGVEVVTRPALSASAGDVLAADGILLGTPANIGYMSGAMKHFFDQVYYPCLDAKRGMLYGTFVHGASDTAGALRAIQQVTTGLGWKQAAPAVSVEGPLSGEDIASCRELGSTLSARLFAGI